jgi:hypothetical protein
MPDTEARATRSISSRRAPLHPRNSRALAGHAGGIHCILGRGREDSQHSASSESQHSTPEFGQCRRCEATSRAAASEGRKMEEGTLGEDSESMGTSDNDEFKDTTSQVSVTYAPTEVYSESEQQ